jgi:heavy metal translocating P-type ATPase
MVVGLATNVSEMPASTERMLDLILLVVTLLVAVLVARPLMKNFWDSLKNREITFEFLFVSGIVGAMGASVASMVHGTGPIYFEIASLLMVIYALGDRIGAISKARSLEAARAWLDANPTCRIEDADGTTLDLPLSAVSEGEIALVFAGEEVPVDGTVAGGEAYLRTSQVTGESRPVVVREGDRVLAGSHVLDATLRIRVAAAAGARAIDSIADRVLRAWDRPSSWQQTANRLVRYFFPAVAAITLATFVGWTWFDSWQTGLINALAVLLVACPCAMGFAVPLAIWMTLGRFARRGLVGHSGDSVERLADVDVVVFDKTGTLTAGTEHLVDVVVDDRHARSRILEIAAAVESTSQHPIARAFQASPIIPNQSQFRVIESRYVPARGVEATLEDPLTAERFEVFIGRVDPTYLGDLASRLHADGSARELGICIDGALVAVAAVDEHPLEGIDELESELARLGITTALLTGDTADRAARIGIAEQRADMTPEQKAEYVDKLVERGHHVLYVGDGLNDAGGMASSHVSIAHARGSDLAVDLADLTWHGDRPAVIPAAIESARESVSLIRQNLYYAAGYNLIGIGAAAAGVLHPVAAAVIMVVSSLFVTWRTVQALDPTATHAYSSDSDEPPTSELDNQGPKPLDTAVASALLE